MSASRLRVNDIVQRFRVSRKTVYNAINSGRLHYHLVRVNNREVRLFDEPDVLAAFPRAAGGGAATADEVKALKEEVAALRFALAELQKAIDRMEPDEPFAMTGVKKPR